MRIETTIYCTDNTKYSIGRIQSHCAKTRSSVIIDLTKLVLKNRESILRYSRAVRYQNRMTSGKWHRMHVSMLPKDYELLLDLRKLCKCSVSLLVACAVERYIKSMKEDLDKVEITDNYHFNHYMIIKELHDTIICWKIYWGEPKNIETAYPTIIIKH